MNNQWSEVTHDVSVQASLLWVYHTFHTEYFYDILTGSASTLKLNSDMNDESIHFLIELLHSFKLIRSITLLPFSYYTFYVKKAADI